MLYKIEFAHPVSEILPTFCEYKDVHAIVKANEDRFTVTYGPAHQDDIDAELERLAKVREHERLLYEVSPWGEKPRWRKRLWDIDKKIALLKSYQKVAT